ncbi:uncharacterized protein BDZ99DRAFT_516276 [Mytilinidion resinicola]|uniref:Uncharacterized protein n=1 Tax=Mytilinidion resinicola TaxID=574789 RepID=A0A6A6Z414_9PEZI|nr:uncharacterized protein BDZ99DRAFT_516276 [Mytilinidion resinicola]KAF2815558.1 hypothetical protein BDZ99DRAFT_516276 [Mytilinidion resinicola]
MRGFRPNDTKGRRQHPSQQPSSHNGAQDALAATREDGFFDPNMFSWEEDVPAGLLPEDQFDRAMEALHFPAAMSCSTPCQGTLSAFSAHQGVSRSATGPSIPEVEKMLTTLLQNISEHILTIPPLSMWPSASSSSSGTNNSRSTPETYPHPDGSQGDTGFAIEETFSLTQTLVGAYQSFVSSLNRTSHQGLCTTQAKTSHSSLFLLISCHLRLLEMWDVVSSTWGTVLRLPRWLRRLRESPTEQHGGQKRSERTSLDEATRLSGEALAGRATEMVQRVDEIQLQVRDANI